LQQPVIWYAIIYDGPSSKAKAYAQPLADLGPLHVDSGEVPMPDLALLTFMSLDTIACKSGFTSIRYPLGLKSYNVAAVRKVYDDINSTLKKIPELSGSIFLLEGYSTHAVKAVDEESTAFPHRSDELLITPFIVYEPNSKLDAVALEFGRRLRSHLLADSDDPEHLRAYVNYAHGDESAEAIYGWEPYRLEKLRALKHKWDPENTMRWYAPFV